ncbi:MAG: hypothetical protein JWQ72_3887 [Polaromonas sp.]|nr:hypothetical protein [Polaromonas sp.]
MALVGIDLAVCSVVLALLCVRGGATGWKKLLTLACLVLLWWPIGPDGLPGAAYLRGITGDLSVTTLALACLALLQRMAGRDAMPAREKSAVHVAVLVAACVLYPLALGLGDWDPYRLGWGSYVMVLALLLVVLCGWGAGLRLLPVVVGAALIAWSGGLMESGNLWDHLLDPWAVLVSLSCGARACVLQFRRRRVREAVGLALPAS